MKKTALMMVAVMITSFTFAQKIQVKDVPASVKTAFDKLHPNTKNIKWEKEKDNYEAGFELNKVEQSVLLDAKGNVLEKEVEIELNQLPNGVLAYVKKNYEGQTVKEASMITDANGTVTYEAEIKGKDLLFDKNGKFIKESID